jgi:hypothetical protein
MYELTEVPQHGIHRFFHPSFPDGPETESNTPIGTPNPLAALPFTNSSPCFIPTGVIISDLAETSQDDLNPTIRQLFWFRRATISEAQTAATHVGSLMEL